MADTIDTKKLRELAEEATPGPWTNDAQLQRTSVRAAGMYLAECDVDSVSVHQMLANAAYIAAANPQAVIALLDEIVDLQRSLDDATGPHCSSCGNAIDPDTCWCGSELKSHTYGDGCPGVPMGCDCLRAERDWKKLATARGERLWQAQRELDQLKMSFSDLADDLCGLQPVGTPDDAIRAISQHDFKQRQELERLRALINTPRTDDFFEAVRIEAAHQIERWGVQHDAGKRPEDWITLFVYLLGKAAKAHYEGDSEKLLHHIITVAAVALNWHRNATGVNTDMRPGVAPLEAAT